VRKQILYLIICAACVIVKQISSLKLLEESKISLGAYLFIIKICSHQIIMLEINFWISKRCWQCQKCL